MQTATIHRLAASASDKQAERGAQLGRRLIAETLEEIGYEDAKVARIFAAMAVTTSAVTAGFFAGDWSPGSLDLAYRAIWFAGVVCALLALGVIAAAAITQGGRRSQSPAERLASYGHAAAFPSEQELTGALRGAESDELERVGERLWQLSRVLTVKKRLLRVGFACTLLAVSLCLVPVVGAALS